MPGVEDALVAARDRVVAVSPIVAGAALKGPADRMLAELGHEVLRRRRGADLRADRVDASSSTTPTPALAAAVEAEGVACTVVPTIMSGPAEALRWRAPLSAAAPRRRRRGDRDVRATTGSHGEVR